MQSADAKHPEGRIGTGLRFALKEDADARALAFSRLTNVSCVVDFAPCDSEIPEEFLADGFDDGKRWEITAAPDDINAMLATHSDRAHFDPELRSYWHLGGFAVARGWSTDLDYCIRRSLAITRWDTSVRTMVFADASQVWRGWVIGVFPASIPFAVLNSEAVNTMKSRTQDYWVDNLNGELDDDDGTDDSEPNYEFEDDEDEWQNE